MGQDGGRAREDGSVKTAFALVAGVLYVVAGGFQLVARLGAGGRWSEALLLGGGAIDALVLVIVGLVLLTGHRELRHGMVEGVAFVYMGILLALVFAFVDLARIWATWLGGAVLGDGPSAEGLASMVSPAIYLSPMPLAGLLAWRSSFTLVPKGTPDEIGKVLKNDKEAS